MDCLIPGCPNDARNKLSIRCRKPTTLAVWAPDSDAYLCKKHAEAGIEIVISVEPATNAMVKATYESGGQEGTTRTTPISKSAM